MSKISGSQSPGTAGGSTGTVLAWHFVGPILRDGRAVPEDGVLLRHRGRLVMCGAGLHASERIIDALRYAPGETICRVNCGGRIERDRDKLVCSERTILWRVDGSALLRRFACLCALDVIHLSSPPAIVRRYLETQDESLREAAWEAAWAASEAASTVARKAGWYAAWAASEAAWAAAREAQNARLVELTDAAHAVAVGSTAL